MLYAGTENGVYVSWNDGENWQALQTNLPHAPVHWLVVQDHFNDLVIGTYGRGFWILDDITPLQGLNQEIVDSGVHLFQPRDAYRFLMKGAPMEVHDDPSMGDNPKYGASIHYYLKAKRDSNVKISILNAQGEVVDTVAAAKAAGIPGATKSRTRRGPTSSAARATRGAMPSRRAQHLKACST